MQVRWFLLTDILFLFVFFGTHFVSGLLVVRIKKMSMSFFQKKTMFGGLSRVFGLIQFYRLYQRYI